MKPIYTFSIALLALGAFASRASAEVLTPAQAYAAASQEASQGSAQLRRAASAVSPVPLRTVNAAGQPAVYLFSGSEGYIVASAESETPALLGYTSRQARQGAELPDGMVYWMDFYSHQIRQLREGNVRRRMAAVSEDFEPVAPICTTIWNQSEPFNNLCPELNGSRSVTGCVATGMAQAMKAHNWPPQGRGSISYQWSNGGETLSADFSQSVYDWNSMLDNYYAPSTAEQKNAVAVLMRDCGYSVGMNYSPSASGAMDMYIALALHNFFDYDKGIRFLEREYFYSEEWTRMVYEDIAAGMPVVYCGSGAAGGHCFVCDGYSSDGYFHFNWGWGGMSDGYFRLSALAPGVQGIGGNDDNFNSNQSIIKGMRPAQAESALGISLAAQGFLSPRRETYTEDSDVRFGAIDIINYSVAAIEGTIGLKLTPVSGGDPVYAPGEEVSFTTLYDGGYTVSNFTVPFSSFPAEGSFDVTPAFLYEGKWHDVVMNTSLPERLRADIADGTLTFSKTEALAQLEVPDAAITSDIYRGLPFSANLRIVNSGSKDFYGSLAFILYKDDSFVTNSNFFNVSLEAGQEENRDIITKFYNAPAAGDYSLYLSDSFGYIYAGPFDITIAAAPAEAPEATLSDPRVTNALSSHTNGEGNTVYVVDPANIRYEATLTCTQGFFTSGITSYLFSPSSSYPIATLGTSTRLLSAGQSATLPFVGSYAEAEEGERYIIGFYDGMNRMMGNMLIQAGKSGGIDATETPGQLSCRVESGNLFISGASADAEGRIYAADGRLVAQFRGPQTDVSALTAGVYIVTASDSGHTLRQRVVVR